MDKRGIRDAIADMEGMAQIVCRLEEKYKVRYIPARIGEPAGSLGFSYPEINKDIEVPYYNQGDVVMCHNGGAEKIMPGEFLVLFGNYPLVGTIDQLQKAWLYTYAMSEALRITAEEGADENAD